MQAYTALKLLERGHEDRDKLAELAERFVEASAESPQTAETQLALILGYLPHTSLMELFYALCEMDWRARSEEFVDAIKHLVVEERLFTSTLAALTLLRCHDEGAERLAQWCADGEGERWEIVAALLKDNGHGIDVEVKR